MAARSRICACGLLALTAVGCSTDVKPPAVKPAVKPAAIPAKPPAEKAKAVAPAKGPAEPVKKAEPPKKPEFKPGEREIG